MGRPKGSLNKVTEAVRKAARKYSKEALRTLAEIMRTGENEQARIAAARELLDRAHGRPAQAITDGDGGALIPSQFIVNTHDGPPPKRDE